MKNRTQIISDFYEFALINSEGKNLRKFVSFAFISILLFIFLPFTIIKAQNLPKKIRGYKVYEAKISVKNQTEKTGATEKSETFVKIGEPEITDVSLTGITLEISAEIESATQSGTIDFLTFQDFRVNDLAVDVEEYTESFQLEKNKVVVLPKPIKFFLGAKQTLRGVSKEMKESKKEWTVTGKVFIFGRFKKSVLKFKRIVPIEVNLKIKNPLLAAHL
ncbi:MAG: hypothetical protein ABIP06_09945 [Pyrinomonadaceae bacterium]